MRTHHIDIDMDMGKHHIVINFVFIWMKSKIGGTVTCGEERTGMEDHISME